MLEKLLGGAWMQKVLEKIVGIFVSIPIILVFLYIAMYPEESMLFGSRWRYKNEELEPSEIAVKLTRISSIISLVLIVLVLIFG